MKIKYVRFTEAKQLMAVGQRPVNAWTNTLEGCHGLPDARLLPGGLIAFSSATGGCIVPASGCHEIQFDGQVTVQGQEPVKK